MKRKRPPSTAPAGKFSSLVFTFLFSVAFFLTAGLLQAQNPELVRTDFNFLDSISLDESIKNLALPTSASLLVFEENKGILLSRRAKIEQVNLQTGEVEKKLDMDELLLVISEELHKRISLEHCIPDREGIPRNHPYRYAIRFDRVMEYTEPSTFAVVTLPVVRNQELDNKRVFFPGLLVFNDELELLNYYPIVNTRVIGGLQMMHYGGFFDGDLMFIKRPNFYHDRNYDFVKFRLKPDGQYHLIDTIAHWPLAPEPLANRLTYSEVLERDGAFHLMLGDKMLMLKNWTGSGSIHHLPLDDNQYLLDLKPIEGTGWNVAVVANTRTSARGDIHFASWEVTLIDDDYRMSIPQTGFRYRDFSFKSVSVIEEKVMVVMSGSKDNRIGVDVLEFQRTSK